MSNPVVHNPKRVAQENPFKFERIFHEKSEEINSFFIYQNYAPIRFVIYNQEIDFQHCWTHFQPCSIGKSIQMCGRSVLIWKNLS